MQRCQFLKLGAILKNPSNVLQKILHSFQWSFLTIFVMKCAKKQAYYFWLFNESPYLNIFRNSSSLVRLIESLKMTYVRFCAWLLHFMLHGESWDERADNTLKNSTNLKFLAGQI